MATTAGYWRIGNTEVIGDIERHVLDWDETSDQAVGNRHAFEVWADDKTTGNNIATLEIVSNAVAWYSSSALPWSLGTATYPVDTLYTAITATQVVYAGTDGLLSGDAGLTFNASTDALTVAGFLNVGTFSAASLAVGDLQAGVSGSGSWWFDESTEAWYITNSVGTQRAKFGALSAGDNTNFAVWVGEAAASPSGTHY